MPILDTAAREHYHAQGYLLASGLIPSEIAVRAEAAIWQIMGMNPHNPATWQRAGDGAAVHQPEHGLSVHNGLQDPELMACATPEYLRATAELVGADAVHPPGAVHTQNKVPVRGEWSWPKPHIDGIPKEHMHRTFPGPYRIASLIYLSDVERRGGGTAVWPGSQRQIRALAEADPDKYRYLYHLNQDVPKLDLGAPLELAPRRGDVLFFQPLFGHNGTANVGARPRWMMRYFCACTNCRTRWKKTSEWGLWTP